MAERRQGTERDFSAYRTTVYSADTFGPVERNINLLNKPLAVIRKGIEDVSEMYGLNNSHIAQIEYTPHGYIDTWNEQISKDRTPFILSANDNRGLVGVIEGRIYTYKGRRAIFVNWVVVPRDENQDRRRAGIGTYLYSQLEELAQKYGVEVIIAGVNPLNFPSEGLHSKFGYKPNAEVDIASYDFPHDFDTQGELFEPTVSFYQKQLETNRAGAIRHYMLGIKTEEDAIAKPLSVADLVFSSYTFREKQRPLNGDNSIVTRTIGLNFEDPHQHASFYQDAVKGESHTEFAEAQQALFELDTASDVDRIPHLTSVLEEIGDVYFQTLVAIDLYRDNPDFPEAFDKLSRAVDYLHEELKKRDIPDHWVEAVLQRKYTMRLMRNLHGKEGKDKIREQRYLTEYVQSLA